MSTRTTPRLVEILRGATNGISMSTQLLVAARLEETEAKLQEAIQFWETHRAEAARLTLEVKRLTAENERLENACRWWKSQGWKT